MYIYNNSPHKIYCLQIFINSCILWYYNNIITKGGIILTNSELRQRALDSLRGRWGYPILVCLLAGLLSGHGIRFYYDSPRLFRTWHFSHNYFNFSWPSIINFNFFFEPGSILWLLIGGAVSFGLCAFFLKFVRTRNEQIEDFFSGFKFYGNTFVLNLLKGIFISLWTLLFVIPGIIAAISYSMSFYIMVDNPDIDPMEAIRQSKEMMYGNKERFFELVLSFIGWFLLSVITCGIGFLFLTPYFEVTVANFYEELKFERYYSQNNK